MTDSIFYKNRSILTWSILFIGGLIALASIYYTNLLVDELRKRETKIMDLYAKSLEYVANSSDDENFSFLTQEIILPNNSIPAILTDGDGNPLNSRNIDFSQKTTSGEREKILKEEIKEMKKQHNPIVITYRDKQGNILFYNYVYYKNSYLLTQLRYYPYIQLLVIAVFVLIVYLAYRNSKIAEQNRVWAGLAKETAHQLGTPLSSLIA